MKIPPKEVLEVMASRTHRLHHFAWHEVRNNWHRYPMATRDAIADLGWAPGGDRLNPRPAYYKHHGAQEQRALFAVDNCSGEDFLYMHRQMIAGVNEILKKVGNPDYPKIEGWKSIPGPSCTAFPVPPAYETGDSDGDKGLIRVKSPEFFTGVMQVWERYYLLPDNLRRLSLGQLGSLIELTIHNQLHNRWSAKPRTAPPPRPSETDPSGIPEGEWDGLENDYLGDTYSSHVNPVFWYIHGWVDSCIDRWQEANGLKKIDWKGTWEGSYSFPREGGPKASNLVLAIYNQTLHKAPKHDHHLHNLIEVVKLIGQCGIFSKYYDGFGVAK